MASGDITATRGKNSDYPCAKFNGTNSKIQISYNTPQQLSNSFSISAEVYTTAWPTNQASGVFAINRRIGIDLNTNANYGFGVRDSMPTIVRSKTADSQPLNTWVSIVGVYDAVAQTTTIYKDGIATDSDSTAALIDLDPIASLWQIGGSYVISGTVNFHKGFIRNCKMWDRALSAAEALLVGTGNRVTNGLIGEWKLNGNSNDSIGNHNGTDTNITYNNTIIKKVQNDVHDVGNLAAVTDKLIVVPAASRAAGFKVFGAEREA